jgi:dTDP-4-amino-4,6-dideoxygalactose transaminase
MPPIPVTRPVLPPLSEFTALLEGIWERRHLTNVGPLHQELERALEAHLGVPHVSLYTNGTVALMAALQTLGLCGEVITTPFTFVATVQAIRLSGLTPVFVDVEPGTLNLDPDLLEAAIGPETVAIMPVHCYGHPCDTAAIAAIAKRHGLRVIYDAAHAFGVEVDGESLLRAGDLSVLSFHATKVFSTVEGGAVVCATEEQKRRLDSYRNFGLVSETEIPALGQNGKMSEIHAAFGLCHLKMVDSLIEARERVSRQYLEGLADVPGLRCVTTHRSSRHNHAYFPVLLDSRFPLTRDALQARLREIDVLARRYFFPAAHDFGAFTGVRRATPLPVATAASHDVLCLPIYPDLEPSDVDRIINLIRSSG